jgi:predicted TIM-barrel fold metal-dependent hydrolase
MQHMMRVLMRCAAASLLIAAGFFFVPGASAQVQAPSPGLSQQPQNIPDQKLDAAAVAIERVASLKQDYQQRIAAAAPADKERILNEAVNALAKAVTDQGLSVEEYRLDSGSGAERSRRSRKNSSAHSPFGPIVARLVATGWRASLCSCLRARINHRGDGDADQKARRHMVELS